MRRITKHKFIERGLKQKKACHTAKPTQGSKSGHNQ